MRRIVACAFVLLALPWLAFGQSVKLPETVSGKPGEWLVVPAEVDGGVVRWFIADPGLTEVPLASLFGDEWALKAKGRVFKSDVAGRYRVIAWTAKADVASQAATCTVVVGEPSPVPPGPGPGPPGPGPGPDPDPFEAAAGAGLKVLVVVETAEQSKLPRPQLVILTSAAVRTYLNAKCAKEGSANWPAYRVWDKDVDTRNETPLWQKAFAKVPKDKVPWILIGNGSRGFSGPLPASVDETLKLLARFGG